MKKILEFFNSMVIFLVGISATYIGLPVKAASEIIEVESHVTAIYFATDRADK